MALLEPFERLLNRWIGESTAAAERAAALEGRSFAVEIEGLALRVVFRVGAGRVTLAADRESSADASVRGAPLALLGLLEPGSLGRLRDQRVEVAGNVHVAEAFAEMLRFARPDLEGELAGWIGDVAAHEVGTALHGLHAWGTRAGRALEADVAEYLQEETSCLPPATQARAFYADVERLRDDVERAEQRLERLLRGAASSR